MRSGISLSKLTSYSLTLAMALIAGSTFVALPSFVSAAEPATEPAAGQAADAYLVGGPLAGLKLPRYPTYHGEPAGRPGNSSGTFQLELYPDSVENWRPYYGKYMPVRSFFDQQSQVQRWIAPSIPGVSQSGEKGQYAQPLYRVSRSGTGATITENVEPAVDVITLKPGDTVAQGSTGKLDVGMYCVRIVGAVTIDQLRNFRDDLFFTLTINDNPDGSDSNYRVRAGYCDQFYALTEIYFHAPQAREYTFKLTIDAASVPTVIVREVLIDDALAGIERRAFKTKSNKPLRPELVEAYKKGESSWTTDPAKRQARLDRDEYFWNVYPKTNKPIAQFLYRTPQDGGMRKAANRGGLGLPQKTLEEQYGTWESKGLPGHIMARNKKLNLDYTWADFNAGKPLPAPYPIKDDGNGVTDHSQSPEKAPRFFFDLATITMDRITGYQNAAYRCDDYLFGTKPNAIYTRDGLVKFIRVVYELPGYDYFNSLDGLITQSGPFGRHSRNYGRETTAWYLSWYTEYGAFCALYDQLFPLIQGNEELAESVGRFIPWVKNSEDLVKLFDTYLVQHFAKRIMRYHFNTRAVEITRLAGIIGDKELTKPWMEWQFSRTWTYPFPLAGIQHYMVSAIDRSGISTGGVSSSYAAGRNAFIYANDVQDYNDVMGDTPYTLVDRERYPKVFAAVEWPIEMHYAGIQYIRTGDVSGPEKPIGHLLAYQTGFALAGWKWTGDPRHAKILAANTKQTDYSSEEWAAITKAADTLKRLPYFDQRSRYLPNWAGFLETGQQHDELSFRRGVALRTGLNYGHAHDDSLDLQVSAHGLPLVLDGGQRPGYTSPGSSKAAVHNTVTSNKTGHGGLDFSWIRSIADNPGIQYMHARRGEPTGPSRGDRQVALVDVDEGEKSIETSKAGKERVAIKRTPNSYVMDVFRIQGGKSHQYNFHAMVDDQFEWNAQDLKAPADGVNLMGAGFQSNPSNAIGVAPQTLVATWRMQKDKNDVSTNGTEKNLLGLLNAYDPKSPHKFLRLHLFNTQGMEATRAQFYTNKPAKNQMTMISVSNTPESPKEGTAFVALIEPYAGEPIIASSKSLTVQNNENDALRAVAVKVNSVNGHADLLMADGRPEKLRHVEGDVTFAADFALLSADSQGLRLASISGGTVLHSPDIRLNVETRAFNGNIIAVNYLKKQITIDQPWPARSTKQLVEVGHDRKMDAYTLASIKPEGRQSVLTAIRGSDYFLSPISSIVTTPVVVKEKAAAVPTKPESQEEAKPEIKPETEAVDTDAADSGDALKTGDAQADDKAEDTDAQETPDQDDEVAPIQPSNVPVINKVIASLKIVPSPATGQRVGWVLSNGDASKTWRANITSNTFTLDTNSPVTMEDFGQAKEVRLWEYGVGDKIQQRTTASVARIGDKTYQLHATSNMTLSLRGSKIEISTDEGKTWTPVTNAQSKDGWITASFTADQTADALLFVRVR